MSTSKGGSSPAPGVRALLQPVPHAPGHGTSYRVVTHEKWLQRSSTMGTEGKLRKLPCK